MAFGFRAGLTPANGKVWPDQLEGLVRIFVDRSEPVELRIDAGAVLKQLVGAEYSLGPEGRL